MGKLYPDNAASHWKVCKLSSSFNEKHVLLAHEWVLSGLKPVTGKNLDNIVFRIHFRKKVLLLGEGGGILVKFTETDVHPCT